MSNPFSGYHLCHHRKDARANKTGFALTGANEAAPGSVKAFFPYFWSLTAAVESFFSRGYSQQSVISNRMKGRLEMKHTELSDSVAESLGVTKAEGRKAVDAVFAAITDAATRGDEVTVNGFGKFKVKATPAREGRNPSTGVTIQIAAAKKLTLSPAKAIKDRLNG